MSTEKLVEIRNLKTHFKVGDDWAKAIDGISFDIYKGETLGIVGESGSGKSVSVLSLIQLIPNPPGEVAEGEILFKGEKIFDGVDLDKVKKVPRYKYFKGLKESQRKPAAAAFFFLWLILHVLLPIPGPLLFLLSFILDIGVTLHLFFNSPQKKAMAAFREKTYSKMWDFRGREIAMIFQEPMTSLNPVFNIGMQMVEALKPKSFTEALRDWTLRTAGNLKSIQIRNRIITSAIFALIILLFSQLAAGWTFKLASMITSLLIGGAIPTALAYLIIGLDKLISQEYREEYKRLFDEAVRLLDTVGIPDAAKRMGDYPHQFSGGMRQRVMIAMALAKNPSLLIADEPTTALDVTIQAQILDLMLDLKKHNTDAAVVLITHDLAVVAETCERVIVMYGGIIQEVAPVEELFEKPLHPYTLGLLKSIPRPDQGKFKERLDTIPGMVPSILELPVGCKFCTRCSLKEDHCETEEPPLVEVADGHYVRCHVVQDEKVLAV